MTNESINHKAFPAEAEGVAEGIMDSRAPRKTKVLFINTAEFFGPVMQVHSHILKHLDRRSLQAIVVTNSRGDSAARLGSLGNIVVKKYNLGGTFIGEEHGLRSTAGLVLANTAALFSAARILAFTLRERVAVIHCASGPRMLLFGKALSLLTGAKLVVHVHEKPSSHRGLRKLVVTSGLRSAHAVITVSRYIRQQVVNLKVDPAKVWPALNVVDLERFKPGTDGGSVRREYGIDPGAPLVAAIGRIMPQKGQRDLLEAMVMVKDALPDAKALVVGWAPDIRMPGGATYLEELHRFCKEHGLDGRVIFTGPRTDIPNVFAAADVVVVPSRNNDPCPLVVLEAMATGRAVVGTRTGGIPEMLSEDTGALVPPGNPPAMAEAIIRLLQEPVLRQRLGAAARRRVEENFYESRLAEDVAKVYRVVTHKATTSPSPDA